MNAYESEAWRDFAVGVAGASAALVGLLFVAISINLQAIVAIRLLPGRAVNALALLATPLFVCIVLLIPQPTRPIGVELLVIAAVIAPFLLWRAAPSHRPATTPVLGWALSVVAPAVVLTIGLLGASIGLLTHSLGGIYWLPAALALALMGGLFNAWVLLVEVVR